jgi:membrane-bound lytic murein transglycosylase D
MQNTQKTPASRLAAFAILLLSSALLASGCAPTHVGARGGIPPQGPASASSPTSSVPPSAAAPGAVGITPAAATPASSVEEAIHDARALYELGVQQYSRGEMREARANFDRAIERLTSRPGGARADARLADAYADLLNDIQDVETTSYQAGNGLSPASEPPPIEFLDEEVPEISPEQARKERALAEQTALPSDLPIELNDRVLAWIEAYRGRLHDKFQEALTRSGRYIEMIRGILREEGLPEDLAYMVHVESAYKAHAYSRARAKGLWQFIVGTGTRYGLRRDWWIDERSDPELSTRAAAAYLKDLHAMFGDWYLAMAGYNAGEGKIQRALDRTGYKDFWSIARTSHIRLETKNYVPAILAAVVISKDPEKFGFSSEREPRVQYDAVSIDSATDLGVIAKLVESDVDTLRDLNPALARLMTPPSYPDFEVHLPAGTGPRFAEQFASIPVSQRIPWRTHTVQRGETLAAISRRYGVSTTQIRQANGLGQGQPIQSGAALQIPTYVAPPSIGHGDLTRSSSSRSGRSGRGGDRAVHKVRRGETLSSIARRYRISVDQLRSLNAIGPRGTIIVGERLIVSGAKRSSKGAPTSSAKNASKGSGSGGAASISGTTRYKVRQGDTLFRIAKNLSTTVEKICDLNNLSAGDPLVPGRILKIDR